MKNKLQIKDFWLIFNLSFVTNYSISILKIFVAFPLFCLPSFFNSIFLFIAYSLTLKTLIDHRNKLFSKLISHPNTFCLFVFLTFPPNILLFPFYLLSLYHIASAIVSRKDEFNRYFFYEICVFIDKNLNMIGRTALFLEVISVLISFILVLIRKTGPLTFVSYTFMVRQQYLTNNTMKSVCMEVLIYFNGIFEKLPDDLKERMVFISKYFKTSEKEKKDQ